MEHPGAAGSGEMKTWRGGAVVEAGAEAILNNLAQISLLISKRKSETVLNCWRCEWLSDESTGELRWLLRDIKWVQYLVLVLVK